MCDKWYHQENQEAAQYNESEEKWPQVLLCWRWELALPLDVGEGAICVLLRLWVRRCRRVCCGLGAVWARLILSPGIILVWGQVLRGQVLWGFKTALLVDS